MTGMVEGQRTEMSECRADLGEDDKVNFRQAECEVLAGHTHLASDRQMDQRHNLKRDVRAGTGFMIYLH